MTRRATRTFTASIALALTLLAGLAQAAGTPEQLAIDYMTALKKDGLTAAETRVLCELARSLRTVVQERARQEWTARRGTKR